MFMYTCTHIYIHTYAYMCVYVYVYIYICLYVHMFFLSAQGTRWYKKEQIQPISVTWVSVILFYFSKLLDVTFKTEYLIGMFAHEELRLIFSSS